MEEMKLLTLEEMYDVFETEAYKSFREDFEERNGIPMIHRQDEGRSVSLGQDWHISNETPLLYRHIVAEQLLQYEMFEEYEGVPAIYHPLYPFKMIELLMHPLVWQETNELDGIVVSGRIAKETYCQERESEVLTYLDSVNYYALMHFAEIPAILGTDALTMGYHRNFTFWAFLTKDYSGLVKYALKGEHISKNDIYHGPKTYDMIALRHRIMLIAEEKGGYVATKLLRRFQSEWADIKRWKVGMDNMTKEEIEQFEDILMNGFEEQLAEWETEISTEPQPVNRPESFCLLTDTCRAENKVADVEADFRAACKGTAAGLWKTIRFNEGMKYVAVGDLPAAKVYRIIEEYFGKLPFTDRAFREARNKK